MRITPETVTTKKNNVITFRSPEIEDAQGLIDAMAEVASTAPYLLTTAESFRKKPVEDEQKWIEKFLVNPRAMVIVAEFQGKIMGVLDFTGYKPEKVLHRGILGISIHSSLRGEGLGQLYFKKLIQEVRKIGGFAQIELSVMSGNIEAIRLYQKVGFKEFGRRPKAYKMEDGSFCDEVMMHFDL